MAESKSTLSKNLEGMLGEINNFTAIRGEYGNAKTEAERTNAYQALQNFLTGGIDDSNQVNDVLANLEKITANGARTDRYLSENIHGHLTDKAFTDVYDAELDSLVNYIGSHIAEDIAEVSKTENPEFKKSDANMTVAKYLAALFVDKNYSQDQANDVAQGAVAKRMKIRKYLTADIQGDIKSMAIEEARTLTEQLKLINERNGFDTNNLKVYLQKNRLAGAKLYGVVAQVKHEREEAKKKGGTP